MKAILLHHAGGDKYAYRNVQQWLLPEYDSIAVELPGRSDRIRKKLLYSIDEIVEDIFQQIKEEISSDYFFVGMSMGGLLAWLLTDKFVKEGRPLPKYLFFASRMPIEYYAAKPNVKGITSENFWQMILDYGGCPPALVAHKELREFYEPILRADFEAMQDHAYVFSGINKLNIPVSVLYGKEDLQNFDTATMRKWDNNFEDQVEYTAFSGDHFFLYNNKEATDLIKAKLSSLS